MTTSTIEKSLAILDLFETDQLEWTPDAIAARLGLARSTCYRYLKSLMDLGYVVGTAETGYTLGPKISLLEYHMRRKDPVIQLCKADAEAITQLFGGCVMINRFFRDCFICIYTVQSPNDDRELLNRGDAIPLLTGANARAIQAFLSRHRLKKLYDANADYFGKIGYGADFQEFRKYHALLRRERLAHSEGDFRADSAAIAAPLLDHKKTIVGTYSFSFAIGSLTDTQQAQAREMVRAVGLEVSAALQLKRGAPPFPGGDTELAPANAGTV